jgi:hypothetical protein
MVILDSDLHDPPKVIPELIARWWSGALRRRQAQEGGPDRLHAQVARDP